MHLFQFKTYIKVSLLVKEFDKNRDIKSSENILIY